MKNSPVLLARICPVLKTTRQDVALCLFVGGVLGMKEGMKVIEIAFSGYPVTDMERARAFYEGVLGLKPTMAEGEPGGMQWTEYDIGNGTLALGAGQPDWKPSADGCSVGLEVDDFDGAIAHLRSKGVKFYLEPFPTPVCRMAFVSDPDGNSVCIHKRNAG